VIRIINPAISAVEIDLNKTICSGVTPVAMTIFEVLALSPKSRAAAKDNTTPNTGFFVFTR
jgi:hypothetical protein